MCSAYRKRALHIHPDKAAEHDANAFIRLHDAYVDALRVTAQRQCGSRPTEIPACDPAHVLFDPPVQDRWVAKACRVLIDVGRCAAVALSTLNIPDVHVRMPVRCGGSRARVRRFVVDVSRRDASTGEMCTVQQTLCLTIVSQQQREGVHRFAGVGNESAFIPGHRGDVVLHVVSSG